MPVRLDARLNEIIERIANREGVEFVHADMTGGRRQVLTVLIDKPGGVTLDDCARFSERLSLTLDVDDLIPHRYLLEVASPGLDRGLYREADYERFAGLPAHVRTIEPIGGQRNYHGRLLGLDRQAETMAIIEESPEVIYKIPLAKIARANVEIQPGDRSRDRMPEDPKDREGIGEAMEAMEAMETMETMETMELEVVAPEISAVDSSPAKSDS